MTTRTARPSVSWNAIESQTPIKAVAVSLLGPPEGRGGSRGLWWSCPFHEDRNPSFQVSPDRGSWKCWAGCGSGDAPALLMRLEGLTFPEAVQRLASMFGLDGGGGVQAPPPSKPRPPLPRPKAEPTGLPPAEALEAVFEGESRLWEGGGREALAYQRGRGLADATIRKARLGFVASLAIPSKGGDRFHRASGISIPWFDDGRLALLKIRQLGGRLPKYIEAFRDRPSLHPSPAVVKPGLPLIVCEGEFDALLLAQELGDVAAVVTLGSAAGDPPPAAIPAVCKATRLFTAHDADGPGERAAALWPKRAERVRPEGGKDWTDVHAGGFGRIAHLWGRFLPLGSPPRGEDFATIRGLEPDETDGAEAIKERKAIMEADGIEGEPEASLSPAEWLAEFNRRMGRGGPFEALP